MVVAIIQLEARSYQRRAIHALSEISNPYDTVWDIRDRPLCVLLSSFGGAKFDRQLRHKSRNEAPLVAVAKVSKDVSSDCGDKKLRLADVKRMFLQMRDHA
jgi:hypothetical protein